jgi:hypothetical protein
LKIPELVFANLDVDFGRTEADEEIQDLLKFSEGLNLGLHYLSGAIAYDPSMKIDALLASKIVWLMRLLPILTVLLRIPICFGGTKNFG